MNTESLIAGVPRKVTSRHLDRWALVYVRQSSPQQLVRNPESTRVQYALRERAKLLGWDEQRIEVIDEDLGHSGTSVEGRLGFQRLVAEVGLDHVGVILGVEMSRFARSCRDWHQLLETCGVFGTLIADLDGIYDPSEYNDRLLLGLKGTMSEAELHLLKRRLHEGKLVKARRGELGKLVPMGYFRRPSGDVIKDPDEQARTLVETLFDRFQILGTVQGVLRYLNAAGLKLPVREVRGPRKGDLGWHRPNRSSIASVLKNPIYAGAYVLGLHRIDHRKKKAGRPGTGRVVVPLKEWEVFLPNRLPAYISWEQYLTNQERLKANCPTQTGLARNGSSLVAGLIFCGRCGARMSADYVGPKQRLYYACRQQRCWWAGPLCQSLAGRVVDEEVAHQVLEVIKPAALELSLAVADNLELERAREDKLWRQRLERAQFEADRARRQYDAVEPENRLVVRTLEKDWEEKLKVKLDLEEAYQRHQTQVPDRLTECERNEIRTVAGDIPGLWSAPTTTPSQRKEMVRDLIDRVEVTILGESERVRLDIHWAGGYESSTEIARPIASLRRLSYVEPLLARLRALQESGKNLREIAQTLNEEGWHPAKRAGQFTGLMVGRLLTQNGLRTPRPSTPYPEPNLAVNEWTHAGLAAVIPIPASTLRSWIRRNWVTARRTNGPRPRIILWADGTELERLRALRERERKRYPGTTTQQQGLT